MIALTRKMGSRKKQFSGNGYRLKDGLVVTKGMYKNGKVKSGLRKHTRSKGFTVSLESGAEVQDDTTCSRKPRVIIRHSKRRTIGASRGALKISTKK